MPVLVRYCNKCGIRIPPLDLEMGRAIEHQRAYYCAKCTEELVVVADVVEEEEEETHPEYKKNSLIARKRVTHVDRERIPVRHPLKERIRHEEQPRGEFHQPSRSMLPIFLLVIGVLIAVGVIVLLTGNQNNSPKPSPPSAPSDPLVNLPPEPGRTTSAGVDAEAERRLREELENIVKYADDQPEDLKVIVARLEAFLRKSGLPLSLANEAKLRFDTYSRRLRKLASEKLGKVMEKAESLVKELKFEEALKALDDFPQTYMDGDSLRELEKEKQRVNLEKDANQEYLQLAKRVDKALSEGKLVPARKDLREWLDRFGSTLHAHKARERLLSVEHGIEERERQRNKETQAAFASARERAGREADKNNYSEAAKILREFAKKHADRKELAGEALKSALTYEKLADQAASEPPKKPIEPRFRLDFTGAAVVATMKYELLAAVVKSTGEGDNCLSMPAPEASLLKAQFEVEDMPQRLVLAIEHAGAKPPAGKKWKALVTVRINGRDVLKDHEISSTFSVEAFNITKFVRKGANTLEFGPSRKTGGPYLLKKVGIAKSLENAFKPLEDKPEDAGGGAKPADSRDESVFNGRTLDKWSTRGPGKWEVHNGIIVGKHTGEQPDDVGFVFPSTQKSRKWLDYRLTFKVWSNIAGGWQVGVRAREATGGLVTGNLLNASDNFSADKWWKVTLRLDGNKVYASVDGSTERILAQDDDLLPGTFVFGVKLGAIVKFKDIEFDLIKTK